MIYKATRNKRHKLYQLSNEIKDEDEIEEIEQSLEICTLELFRQFVIEKKHEMALDLVKFLSSAYIKITI